MPPETQSRIAVHRSPHAGRNFCRGVEEIGGHHELTNRKNKEGSARVGATLVRRGDRRGAADLPATLLCCREIESAELFLWDPIARDPFTRQRILSPDIFAVAQPTRQPNAALGRKDDR